MLFCDEHSLPFHIYLHSCVHQSNDFQILELSASNKPPNPHHTPHLTSPLPPFDGGDDGVITDLLPSALPINGAFYTIRRPPELECSQTNGALCFINPVLQCKPDLGGGPGGLARTRRGWHRASVPALSPRCRYSGQPTGLADRARESASRLPDPSPCTSPDAARQAKPTPCLRPGSRSGVFPRTEGGARTLTSVRDLAPEAAARRRAAQGGPCPETEAEAVLFQGLRKAGAPPPRASASASRPPWRAGRRRLRVT